MKKDTKENLWIAVFIVYSAVATYFAIRFGWV